MEGSQTNDALCDAPSPLDIFSRQNTQNRIVHARISNAWRHARVSFLSRIVGLTVPKSLRANKRHTDLVSAKSQNEAWSMNDRHFKFMLSIVHHHTDKIGLWRFPSVVIDRSAIAHDGDRICTSGSKGEVT
jgi:hypothetical protein